MVKDSVSVPVLVDEKDKGIFGKNVSTGSSSPFNNENVRF